ncbi:multi-sensor signal transduction histidine kinase [Conexibacter woesei DSM 14684]|uniref:histidine kinase n=2 Tax=Conexibacter TaxID=191494 RepID=D3FFJ2_CONWI|nr:multi-sensor signal transduction histidine kinase [Conexibacter woesei DSM 14684]
MLTVLFLAVLVVMLVAIRDLRATDRAARDTAQRVMATSRAQTELSDFETAHREARSGDAASVRELRIADAGLDHRLDVLRGVLGGSTDSVAMQLRAQLAAIREHVGILDDPDVSRAQLAVEDRRAAAIVTQLDRLVETQRASLLKRREHTGAIARSAEITGVVGIVATILLVAACLYYIRRSVLTPLRRVAEAARSIDAGDLHARVGHDHGGSGEVAELAQTFDQMATSLEDNRTALQRQNAELESRGAELVDAVRSAREGASVLRAVLDATPDAIALLDREGAPIVDNPPMRAVRAAFGERATAIDHNGTLVPLDAATDGGGEEARDEITLLGTQRAFARYAAPVRDGHGRVIGRLLVLREVTGEREAERVKEEFFALVSHELRTPLTAILGYVELVLGEDGATIDEEQHRYLQIVERNAQRLLRLVGDLLFAAQVESGALLLEPGSVDLPRVTLEAVEAARPRAEDAGITLTAQIAPLVPCVGDRDRLAQVLDNLISNALKFTPSGGQVGVRLSAADGEARIDISDTGVGVPAEEHARLFDRFFRASNATTRAVPGVGLGLMIVRAIVAAHGGTIGVDSEVGVGTTFTVRLPLRAVRASDPASSSAPLVAYRDDPPSTGGRYR